MTTEMRRTLATLPYKEKLRRVAELAEFSRKMKANVPLKPRIFSHEEIAAMIAEDEAEGHRFRAEQVSRFIA